MIHETKHAVTSAVMPQPCASAGGDQYQKPETGCEVEAHQQQVPDARRSETGRWHPRMNASTENADASATTSGSSGGCSIGPASRSPRTSTLTAPPLTRKMKSDPPAITTPSAGDPRRQDDWLRQQRRGNRRRQISPLERHQRDRLCADDQGNQKDPTEERRRDEQFEQGVGDRLDDRERPVRGSDERAALQRELERGRERHGGPFNGTSPIAQIPNLQ